ncbi:MAG: tetratricopeptide repeat protein [Acidobacteriota bacterium]
MRTGYSIFAVDDLVAGRYRILRYIARGGAAEVYEAEDQDLGQRIALKAVRREHVSNSIAIERFKREINLARQVTHPNVCRIYEFGHQHLGQDDVFFLTMELLEGETLHDRIQRQGPLATSVVLPLIKQMAAGLEAAQKVGVVHRDFKSGNVILVPSESQEGGLRAVIADFGMARMVGEDETGQVLTQDDLVVGSPAYMAPEQVESGPISAATDIYSVGVVLYEMLTGRFPFQAETALATALMRLKEKPPSPRDYAPELDETWEQAILRCLERDPRKRFASAGDLVAALTGAMPVVEPPRRGRAVALLSAAILAAALGWWVVSRAPERGSGVSESLTAESFTARPSIALLGFRNLSGQAEAAWLSTALSEMLAMEIAAGEKIRVIPGENVTRTRIDLGLEETDGLDAQTLARVGEILGSELLLGGSYLLAGSGAQRELRLDIRVQKTTGGETIARFSDRGAEAEVLNLVEKAGRELRRELDIESLSPDEAASARASMPTETEAVRLYAEGLEKLRRRDAKAALEHLAAAVQREPEHPMIHSALSQAWASLGYTLKARQAAGRAFDLAGKLGRRDRQWVEARFREANGERREAVAIYGALWRFFPDNLEYGLQLAKTQTQLGEAGEALETVETLRLLPAAVGKDPRIDLAAASAARALSRYREQQQHAARAAAKGRQLGAGLLVARAREIEGGAWRDLGEPQQAMAAYDEAKAIQAAAGNRGPVARILIAVAKILRYQGRFDEARALSEEALQVAREIGDQGSAKHALNTLAIILRQQGKLQEAARMHELELETHREIGESRGIQVALTSLGVAKRRLGDLAGATEHFTEALASGRESGNKRSVEINLNMLGEVLLDQGEIESARRSFEEALENNRETGSPRGRAYYLSSLGDVALASGDLQVARELYEEALEIRRSLGETTNVSFSWLALGELALEEGRPDEAADRALAAAAAFESGDQPDAHGTALSLLAAARLAQGRRAEAEAAIEQALTRLGGSQNLSMRLGVSIRAAEIGAAAGRGAAAIESLRRCLEEAKTIGYAAIELDARLTLGRIEAERGDRAAGREALESLAAEARDRGFLLVADKALGILRRI